MSDPVRTLLDELRPDAARVPLPAPYAIRERGKQRGRRQVWTSVAASAVAAALFVGGAVLLGSRTRTEPAPPVSRPSATATQSPRVIALLQPTDLPGPVTGKAWRAVEHTEAVLDSCALSLAEGHTSYERGYVVDSTTRPGAERAVNLVVSLPSPAAAQAALLDAEEVLRSCWGPTTVAEGYGDAGDAAVLLRGRYDPPDSSDAVSGQAVAIVRLGSDLALVAVSLEGVGSVPYLGTGEPLLSALATVLQPGPGQLVTAAAQVEGAWKPLQLRGRPANNGDLDPLVVEFARDGAWRADDGCAEIAGSMTATSDGGLVARVGSRSPCGRSMNAPIGWASADDISDVVTAARQARLRGTPGETSRRLVLLSADGAELGVFAQRR